MAWPAGFIRHKDLLGFRLGLCSAWATRVVGVELDAVSRRSNCGFASGPNVLGVERLGIAAVIASGEEDADREVLRYILERDARSKAAEERTKAERAAAALLVAKLQADLAHEEGKYKQERVGRIRMQKKLEGEVGFSVHHGGMQSIGRLDSVFRKRFGTPRQGLVVPYARARLKVDAQHYPKDSLDGLQEYSHVWLIYLFHANTNTARRTKDQTSAVRSKVRPHIPSI